MTNRFELKIRIPLIQSISQPKKNRIENAFERFLNRFRPQPHIKRRCQKGNDLRNCTGEA